MLDNPLIQFLVVLFFGFCLGILFMEWYMVRITKNIMYKIISLIGHKIKTTDISFKEVLRGINSVLDKAIEEVESERKENKNDNEKPPEILSGS